MTSGCRSPGSRRADRGDHTTRRPELFLLRVNWILPACLTPPQGISLQHGYGCSLLHLANLPLAISNRKKKKHGFKRPAHRAVRYSPAFIKICGTNEKVTPLPHSSSPDASGCIWSWGKKSPRFVVVLVLLPHGPASRAPTLAFHLGKAGIHPCCSSVLIVIMLGSSKESFRTDLAYTSSKGQLLPSPSVGRETNRSMPRPASFRCWVTTAGFVFAELCIDLCSIT